MCSIIFVDIPSCFGESDEAMEAVEEVDRNQSLGETKVNLTTVESQPGGCIVFGFGVRSLVVSHWIFFCLFVCLFVRLFCAAAAAAARYEKRENDPKIKSSFAGSKIDFAMHEYI